ncbi:inovirus Gp2 family protein, partial [Pseudomonas aeruginosa]|uniref:inovirus Gp2 family protein n=1 Tax=Pseudomonas aeruginosa TaxID=287 RepID=UPI0021E7FC3D
HHFHTDHPVFSCSKIEQKQLNTWVSFQSAEQPLLGQFSVSSNRPHYHLLVLLNRDAYYGVGRLVSSRTNNVRRMEEAWASALRLPVEQVWGLVHIPERAEYRIDRYIRTGDHDALPELLHRVSYLCKAATKSYGDRQRGFGTSRG